MTTTPLLLTHLAITPTDRTITIIEHELADANFILTHLIKQILSNQSNRLLFVICHNTLGHYQNVLKRLGIDLMKRIDDGDVVVMQGLKTLLDEILDDGGDGGVLRDKITEVVFDEIQKTVDDFTQNHNVFVMVDDFSHLFDLGVDLRKVLTFVNRCMNLTNNERVSVVLGSHVSDNSDRVVVNNLTYTSDVTVVVSTLKTGRSRDVTGVIDIIRNRVDKRDTYHYLATEKEIKTFCPGQSLNYLYK